jgi:hypothetical protein
VALSLEQQGTPSVRPTTAFAQAAIAAGFAVASAVADRPLTMVTLRLEVFAESGSDASAAGAATDAATKASRALIDLVRSGQLGRGLAARGIETGVTQEQDISGGESQGGGGVNATAQGGAVDGSGADETAAEVGLITNGSTRAFTH